MKYEVRRAVPGGPSRFLYTVDAAVTSFTDVTAVPGTRYQYDVRAYDQLGPGLPSTTVFPKTPPSDDAPPETDVQAPTTPPNLRVAGTSGAVDLVWDAATDDVGVYRYVVRRDGVDIAVTAGDVSTYRDTAVSVGHTYTYTVVAGDDAGNLSAPSGPVTAGVTGSPPPAPDAQPPTVAITSPVDGATVSGKITVLANAVDPPGSSDGAGIGQVEFFLDGSSALTDKSSAYNYSVDTQKLTNGTHTIRADAADKAGNKASASITVMVKNADTTAPSAPGKVTVSAVNATTVKLTWAESTDSGSNASGVARYNVVRNGAVIAQTTSTSYTDSTASANTKYTYLVQAVDGAGNTSKNSSSKKITTPKSSGSTPGDKQAPAAPSNLSATATSATQVNLSWSASTDQGGSGLAGYNVYRNGKSSQLNGSLLTTTTYGDGTVTAGTSYSYQVEAVDGAGNKSAKATVSVKTSGTAPQKDTSPPTAPSNLAATAISPTRIDLSWTAATDNVAVATYIVRRSGTDIATIGPVASYSDTIVKAATNYKYKVRALDAAGNQGPSTAEVSRTTPSQ